MAEMTPEREARELAPCRCGVGEFNEAGRDPRVHASQCPAQLRDGITAALRAERERADAAEREREAYKATATFTKRAWDEFADDLRRITGYTGPDSGDVLLEHVKTLTREVERLRSEVWTAHVPVTGTQHDPSRGLIHGCCERCRMPWPCDYSPERALTPSAPEDG